MRGNVAALAKGRETRDANAAKARAERIARGAITAWDARWLKEHGQEIPVGVHVVRNLPQREPKAKPIPPREKLYEEISAIHRRAFPEAFAAVEKPGPTTFAPRQPQVFGVSENPRQVVPGEVDGLLAWGLPHFAVCFPDATRDNIRPMLMLACNGAPAHFVRTKHAVGLFAFERTPWNPHGTVHKVFVVAREHAPAEVLAIYAEGERWAVACGAKYYHYEQCAGYPVEAIADRIGYDATRVTYSKRLK